MADWVTAVVAAASGLAGATVTQGVTIWQARLQADRDDRARSWESRREVYVEFLRGLNSNYAEAEWRGWLGYPPPPEDDLYPLYHRLDEIKLFGTPDIHAAGMRALDALSECVYHRGEQDQASVAAFVDLARRDLQVPD